MIKKRFLKTMQGICLGAALSLLGAFGTLAEPLGLSMIEGQTITSRMGGFQAQVPASYQVDRMGGGWEISRQLVAQMKTSDQMQIDFAASMVNETDKTLYCKYGICDAGR